MKITKDLKILLLQAVEVAYQAGCRDALINHLDGKRCKKIMDESDIKAKGFAEEVLEPLWR